MRGERPWDVPTSYGAHTRPRADDEYGEGKRPHGTVAESGEAPRRRSPPPTMGAALAWSVLRIPLFPAGYVRTGCAHRPTRVGAEHMTHRPED